MRTPSSFGTALKDGSWFDYLGTGEFLLIVNVTARNPDPTKPAELSVYDFRLKGPDNTVYPLLEQSPVATQPRFAGGVENLPGGRIQISSQQLAPGETVKGSLVFFVPKPVSRFTLTYHGTTQQLTCRRPNPPAPRAYGRSTDFEQPRTGSLRAHRRADPGQVDFGNGVRM